MSALRRGAGHLRRQLERAAEIEGVGQSDLTVLSPAVDPYRFDTAAGHRDGAWFAAQVQEFVGPGETIHLRGLHYVIASAGNRLTPQGTPYTNTDANWSCLCDRAAKAARWLGYVAFSRIRDERNQPPQLFVPEAEQPNIRLVSGLGVDVPSVDAALPEIRCFGSALQPYRIILVGEKSSLGAVLLPIATRVGGELLLPTGEASDTMIAELAARADADGRPAVVLYFSDFDPAGHQMPISFARKLQALRDLQHPNLMIELHPVALTVDQVRDLHLPSTPLKATEQRAGRWRAIQGHEQTEIDALAALRPHELKAIAERAIRPYFDETLAGRVSEAKAAWYDRANWQVTQDLSFISIRDQVSAALLSLEGLVASLRILQGQADLSVRAVAMPAFYPPEPIITETGPRPLFTTDDSFAAASRRLKSRKALDGADARR